MSTLKEVSSMADASFTTTPGALLRRFLRAAAAEVSAFAAAAGPPLCAKPVFPA
jgi:hypothetical protein